MWPVSLPSLPPSQAQWEMHYGSHLAWLDWAVLGWAILTLTFSSPCLKPLFIYQGCTIKMPSGFTTHQRLFFFHIFRKLAFSNLKEQQKNPKKQWCTNRKSIVENVCLDMSFYHLSSLNNRIDHWVCQEIKWKLTDENIGIHCRLWISGITLNKQTGQLTNKYINT